MQAPGVRNGRGAMFYRLLLARRGPAAHFGNGAVGLIVTHLNR
jgi:hypothetical protein